MAKWQKRNRRRTDPYEDLANAIIFKATRDYQNALVDLYVNEYNEDARDEKKSCERFFKSDYFKSLTGIDGKYLMAEAKKQIERRGFVHFEQTCIAH